jgi:hypothetical protein
MMLEQRNTLDPAKQSLDGTLAVAFNVTSNKQECYQWLNTSLVNQHWLQLNKKSKRYRYLLTVAGYSHTQTKRLIRRYTNTGLARLKRTRCNGFTRTYNDANIRLLERVDELHEQPSGTALEKRCERG